ncbi:MAG: hypothetical protein OQK82_04690 [Candidatus Pacearchaeota archaeon]|nr:hypothetical protein [Candidatus Pacearchaeota archaeon]
MKRRGMSQIITTVIMIGIVLVAVGVVWVVVQNIIGEGLQDVSLGSLRINLNIESVKDTANGIDVKVKRNSGEADLVGLNFIVSDGKDTEVFEVETNMKELATQTFSLDYDGFVESVEVAPVLVNEEGREKVYDSINFYDTNWGGEGFNWDFEEGAGREQISSLEGWEVVSSEGDVLDHVGDLAYEGKGGFGRSDCCDPTDSGKWSINKYFKGDFSGEIVELDLMVKGAAIYWSSCSSGEERVGEDDARFWVYAYNSNKELIQTDYSKRASWWKENGGALNDGWINLNFDYIAPFGTEYLKVEIFADDGDGDCYAEGFRGDILFYGNAAVYFDEFYMLANLKWEEVESFE